MKTIFTILFTLLSFFSFSQDYIFLRDGETSIGHITKVSKNKIRWEEKTSTRTLPLSMVSGFKKDNIKYRVIYNKVYESESGISFKESQYYRDKDLFSPYPLNKYYDVRSKSTFNLRKGNNRIMAGAFFILLSGATSITHFLIRDASSDIYTTITIAAVTFNMTGGAFILSGARKNKKESEKIRFIRDK